jgi:glycosyltransferase 2 family protein
MPARRSALLRLLVGIAISAVFLAVTLRNVDLGKAADAIGHATPAWLAAGLGIVLVDLCLRALRWHVLLRSVEDAPAPPSYRLAFGYLTLGFAANFVLPARLGDIARAVLAADAFRLPRLSIFGTILIERVSDGLTFLVLAILSSLVVASASELRNLTVYAIALVGVGLVAAVVGWLAITRSSLASTGPALAILGIVRRLSAGAGAFREPRPAATFLALPAMLAKTATLVAWSVLQAVGVALNPIQTVLFLSGIALSLAIPAAPGSIGTYEFVGTAIITGLGYTPEQGLATILLMRILTTFPPALIGLVSIWALHVRPGAIAESAEGPPAGVEPT